MLSRNRQLREGISPLCFSFSKACLICSYITELKKVSLSETRISLTRVWKAPSSCLVVNIFRIQKRCFLRFWSWRCRRLRTKRRNRFACRKISSSMSTMLFALIFLWAQRACTFDIFAQRNEWLQSALRSFALVCDYMETAPSLRSSAICDPIFNLVSLQNGAKMSLKGRSLLSLVDYWTYCAK